MLAERSSSFSSHAAPQTVYPRGKPLIEYCTNEWRDNPKYSSLHGPSNLDPSSDPGLLDHTEACLSGCLAVIKAPRLRRLMLVLAILITSGVSLWVKVIQPWIIQERVTRASLTQDPTKGLFGANVTPYFPSVIQIARMDPRHLPGRTTAAKRLIFVGDIHGCKKELLALMDKVAFNPHTDHLVAVGDVINKGPDSLGVIDFLRANNASCVRGNHEDTLLLLANDLRSPSLHSNSGKAHLVGEALDDDPLINLIHDLTHEQLTWLQALPVILEIGNVKGLGDLVVVHGGLVPGVPLTSQDPVSVMNMRIIDLATHVPSPLHEYEGSLPWFRLWNSHQKLLQKQSRWKNWRGKPTTSNNRTLVVYGHDAKRGLQINKFTKGLDSRCVKGGQLSALVVSSSGKQQIKQVNCPGYYTKPASKQGR